MKKKKKRNPNRKLSAEERPLFVGIRSTVIRTKKDKYNNRQNQKLRVKKYEEW